MDLSVSQARSVSTGDLAAIKVIKLEPGKNQMNNTCDGHVTFISLLFWKGHHTAVVVLTSWWDDRTDGGAGGQGWISIYPTFNLTEDASSSSSSSSSLIKLQQSAGVPALCVCVNIDQLLIILQLISVSWCLYEALVTKRLLQASEMITDRSEIITDWSEIITDSVRSW